MIGQIIAVSLWAALSVAMARLHEYFLFDRNQIHHFDALLFIQSWQPWYIIAALLIVAADDVYQHHRQEADLTYRSPLRQITAPLWVWFFGGRNV